MEGAAAHAALFSQTGGCGIPAIHEAQISQSDDWHEVLFALVGSAFAVLALRLTNGELIRAERVLRTEVA